MEDTTELTEEDLQNIQRLVGTTPAGDDKQNVHTFLHNVAIAEDTTKTGNLRDDEKLNELGIPSHPVRTYKELELYCRDVADMDYFAEYFKKSSEIITSTSLSREAKLLSLAVVQKKEIADVTKRRVVNKGWFKRKEPEEREGV